MRNIKKDYEFIVVGGGLSGVCTAISAARHGVKTALIQDRPVLGGNASSELGVAINGAGRADGWKNAVESGIILEILMKNKEVNPQAAKCVQDNVIYEKTKFQDNLDLYLNTSMHDAKTENNKITEITAYQMNTETKYTFTAKYFADNTGDATLSYLAGADFTIGHEARATYNESLAPIEANSDVMGSTVFFGTTDMGRPIPFKRPFWAVEYTREMLGKRLMPNCTGGYWWLELDHTIDESQDVREELLKYVYGIFDYIKNSGDFPESANLALTRITPIAGKRESRRVYGDYVLNQNDIDNSVRFEDTIAYGGWTMDDHSAGGLKNISNPDDEGTIWHPIPDIYTIPYRCIYSRNVDNLFIGGRAISASHMAMSSTRVMSTCSVIGQAAGVAAYIANRENITPREVSKHMHELQQTLIKDDCYLPGIKTCDEKDLVKNVDCEITASSFIKSGEPENINGDYARRVGDVEHGWISDKISENGEYLQIKFAKDVSVSNLILRFDPNFSKVMCGGLFSGTYRTDGMLPEMPETLVRDYTLTIEHKGKVVKTVEVIENCQRVNKIDLGESFACDCVKVHVTQTFGDDHVRINDCKIYE